MDTNMKKYLHLLLLLLLTNCSLLDTNSDSELCYNGCSGRFTDIVEVGSNVNALTQSAGHNTLYFDRGSFEQGPTYFVVIVEANRPKQELTYNGEYWVVGSVRSNKSIVADLHTIPVGKSSVRFTQYDTHNIVYGNNGIPSEKVIAGRVVVGPVLESMMNQTITLEMTIDFELGGTFTTTETYLLKIK